MMLQLMFKTNVLTILCIGLLLGSCGGPNSRNDENSEENKKAIDPKSHGMQTPMFTLDTLKVDSATFMNSVTDNRKLALKFFIHIDTLTLHGWSSTNNGGGTTDFNNAPNLKLQNGNKSEVRFTNGYYMGDFIMQHGEIRNLRRNIQDSGASFILFVPELDTSGQIHYRVHRSKNVSEPYTNQTGDKYVAPLATMFYANPSPPKSF
jgi:hypothetical protein